MLVFAREVIDAIDGPLVSHRAGHAVHRVGRQDDQATGGQRGGRGVDAAFKSELIAFLERYRLAGQDRAPLARAAACSSGARHLTPRGA